MDRPREDGALDVPAASAVSVDVSLGQTPAPFRSRVSPAPSAPSPEVTLGMFGKYRLVQHLAVGGMAQLYLSSLDGPDGFSKQCVVKTILPEFAVLPDFNEMFVNEAKVAALLHHPNIVQVYDFGREGGRYFLAMEYVRGASLQQILREAYRAGMTLGPRFAITIGAQMCDAMGYAQALKGPDGRPLNLVHRDLTTGNILVSSGGVAKLTDFGIVKTELNMSATAAGVVKGKYPYMSPEQIRAEPIDHRSDIFSLGVVLYEVATGVALFRRRSLADTIAAVAHAQVRKPTEFLPAFPPQFERILLKTLALNRDDRFQSFAELGQALDAFRLSRNWTASSRELASLVQTLFPGGVAPGAYVGTASGLMPAGPDEVDPPELPSQVEAKPPSPEGSRLGPVELGLIALALAMLTALTWLLTLPG
jgi:serine/threonine-protein kinase